MKLETKAKPKVRMKPKRWYTALLLYPEYTNQVGYPETYFQSVKARTPKQAVGILMGQMMDHCGEIQSWSDIKLLLLLKGNVKALDDGEGNVG